MSEVIKGFIWLFSPLLIGKGLQRLSAYLMQLYYGGFDK